MRLEAPLEQIQRCVTCNDSYATDQGWPHPCQCMACAQSRKVLFDVEIDGQVCVKRVAIGNLGHGDGNTFAQRWLESLGYKVGPYLRRL